MRVQAVDYHTAGEPLRIVAEPPVVIDGATLAHRRVCRPAVVQVVTGAAYRVARSTFEVDPHDPLVPGFVLR